MHHGRINVAGRFGYHQRIVPRHRWLPAAAAICLLLGPLPATAQRALHWRELAVQARLEADGTLAVREDHAMVFSGDWNGGERTFRVRLGQSLTVDRVSRRDAATGAWVPLAKGSLDAVDQWKWAKGETLRWRSRLPTDPDFAETEIDYRIEYRLSGILRRDGEVWVLDHDFAFPDRVGEITRFVLDLDFAPEWQAAGAIERHVEDGPLAPGASRVVTARLRYVGAGVPANAAPPRPATAMVVLVLAAAALGVGWLLRWGIMRERALGRFAQLPPISSVDRSFLDAHLFALSPEEAGAAWDDTVGSAEVAALLARMQLEGKLASRIEEKGLLRRPNLHLSLLVQRSDLSGVEHRLVSTLFPSGDETDTASLRKHYATSGFDPSKDIEPNLRDKLRARGGFSAPRLHPARRPSALLIALGLTGIAVGSAISSSSVPAAALLAFAAFVLWIPAFIAAFTVRRRITGWRAPLVVIAVSQALALVVFSLLGAFPGQTVPILIGGALLLIGLARTVATALQSRQGEETITRRRNLAAARAWFAAELERPDPRLEDAWAPYLIAFGLAPRMDRWWKSFGGATAPVGRTPSSSWSGGSGSGGASTGGGGWTGGGGSFGGAGATASWAMAATSMSAGVAAASSGGSGGGGGGGGGGSSGGGGGGGW